MAPFRLPPQLAFQSGVHLFKRSTYRSEVCKAKPLYWFLFATMILCGAGRVFAQTDSSVETQKQPTWVRPVALVQQLEKLKEIPEAATWATDALDTFEAMEADGLSAQAFNRNLNRLQELRNQLHNVSSNVWGNSRLSHSQWLERMGRTGEIARIGYRIDRRMKIWRDLQLDWSALSPDSKFVPASFQLISFDGLDPGWVEYLRLKDFKTAFGAIKSDPKQQTKVSREILARIYSPVLKPAQRAYLTQQIDPSLIRFLKAHASEPVDQVNLLKRLERFEATPNPIAGHYLNSDYQSLLWSDEPHKQMLALEIDKHYRNANFRLVVSDRLLNRMIPELPNTQMPVSETVKGAQISGNSQISNRLRVALDPNPNQIALRLETDGYVQSDTIARTNNFRVANQGEATFQVSQRLLIGREGIDASGRPYSSSVGKQHVVGLESKLDNVPLVGWMARRLAENKLRGDAPETDQIFKQKVQVSAENKMQAEVAKYVDRLRYYSYTNLFQPLMAMDLEPEAVQMATTHNQVVMRYRLAGRDQMAANTARPRDNSNSLLSFQIHQSAINNAIERVGLNGETFTIDELKIHLADLMGRPVASDQQSEDQAVIGFAKLSPIQVDFTENRFNITLNLATLKIGDRGKTLKKVKMRASYIPSSDGMRIKLVQDDQGTLIQTSKKRSIGEKALVSTVMKKMFKKEYVFNSLPQKMSARIGGQYLDISQLVVADGWLGVSIDDSSPMFQATPAQPQPRLGIRRIFNRR